MVVFALLGLACGADYLLVFFLFQYSWGLAMKLPEVWTLIAESVWMGDRARGGNQWIENPKAVISLNDARRLFRQGSILMTQKRLENGNMGLMVKVALQGQNKDA